LYRDPQECYTLPFGKSRGIGVWEGTGARAVGGRSQGNERRHARVTDYWSTARPFTCHSRPFRYLFAGAGFGIFFYQRQNPYNVLPPATRAAKCTLPSASAGCGQVGSRRDANSIWEHKPQRHSAIQCFSNSSGFHGRVSGWSCASAQPRHTPDSAW